MSLKKKFVWALVAYAALAVLALTTLSNEPIRVWELNVRLRTGTLLVLGLFVLRTVVYFCRTPTEERADQSQPM
ncbi:MAG: hypothetical protein JOZ14_01620 [Acidobacteria bacterium]|nr:hypothetical protein [Acidobacteriota bacterium]